LLFAAIAARFICPPGERSAQNTANLRRPSPAKKIARKETAAPARFIWVYCIMGVFLFPAKFPLLPHFREKGQVIPPFLVTSSKDGAKSLPFPAENLLFQQKNDRSEAVVFYLRIS